MIKKFNQYIKESNDSELETIRSANGILKRYKDSPMWNEIISYLNKDEIDYSNWSDLDILDYYISLRKNDINESAGDEITDMISSNMWNYLVIIINKTKDEDIKKYGSMLISQLNTAGGSHLMKDEVVNFIYRNKNLIPDLVSKG